MAKLKVTDVVLELVQPIAADNGCEVVDVEFKKEGADYFLRVFIDLIDAGEGRTVSLNECEAVSRALSTALDKADPIEQAYMLEVSSPGLDRPLKKDADFEKFSGRLVDVGLYRPQNGSKTITGTLQGLEDGEIVLSLDDGSQRRIARTEAASVKLAVVF